MGWTSLGPAVGGRRGVVGRYMERLGVDRKPVDERQLGDDRVDQQVVVGRELDEQVVVEQVVVEQVVVGRELDEQVVVEQVVVEQELVGRRLGRLLDVALCPAHLLVVSIASPSS